MIRDTENYHFQYGRGKPPDSCRRKES